MHPTIDEICRARLPIRPEVFGRWQKTLREQIQPRLDELDTMKAHTPTPKDGKKRDAA